MNLAPKWTKQEEELLAESREYSLRDIYTEFTNAFMEDYEGFGTQRSMDAIRRKLVRKIGVNPRVNPRRPSKPVVNESTPDDDTEETLIEDDKYQAYMTRIAEIQKKYSKQSVVRKRGVISKDKSTTKILSLSDIHFPLARLDFLEQALKEHSDADILVLNGDLMEGYLFSTYEKDERILTVDEYMSAFMFVLACSEIFPKVVLVEGNHDDRAGRLMNKLGLDKETLSVFNLSLMGRIANGEWLDKNGKLLKKIEFKNVYFQQHESWYVKIGKTIFIHPSTNGSSKPGFTVSAWNDKFQHRYDPGTYDAMVCGHTHQISKCIINGTLLIEQGCLAGLLGYSWSRRNLYKTNGQNGYAVIYQDKDGNTDFNRSQPIYLGEILPPKKSLVLEQEDED